VTGAAEAILVALVGAIIDLVRRGLLSEECVAGLCAAHPELRGKIDALPAARYRDARRAATHGDADELPRLSSTTVSIPALRAGAKALGPTVAEAVDRALVRAGDRS
jgi:hypothetical protein